MNRFRELPFEASGIEHGAFHAGAFVVPGAVGVAHFSDARVADADAAGHGCFE